MSGLDDELTELQQSVKSINKSYDQLGEPLHQKWKQIRKLDSMERDLNKLKYLSELPNLFKNSLAKF